MKAKLSISAQQSIFFTKQGYIELELPHDELFASIAHVAAQERDLWRKDPALQQFLTRTLGPLALVLTGKKQLSLGCDHYFKATERPKTSGPIKPFFSIQGLALGVAIAKDPIAPIRPSPLGILPLPSTSQHILFFRPDLILDWPHVTSDVYLAFYALPTAVYVHNAKDPHTNQLKKFGLQFGDLLKNETHPLII